MNSETAVIVGLVLSLIVIAAIYGLARAGVGSAGDSVRNMLGRAEEGLWRRTSDTSADRGHAPGSTFTEEPAVNERLPV
ncbi:MAG: hypothetical protein ABEJ66_03480 [Candidatus Nanohaloarchaea archaeon]